MGEVVSLSEYKAKHHPGYIRGIILDAKTSARDGWTKEESDKKVAEARKRSNARVKAEYKVGSKQNG